MVRKQFVIGPTILWAGSSARYDGGAPSKSSTGATSKEQKPVTKTAPRDYLDDFETDDIEEITI
jgi:hypothetical protein